MQQRTSSSMLCTTAASSIIVADASARCIHRERSRHLVSKTRIDAVYHSTPLTRIHTHTIELNTVYKFYLIRWLPRCGGLSDHVQRLHDLLHLCHAHTHWFLSIYALMDVLRSCNQHRVRMAVKLVVYALINAAIFDIPTVAGVLFRPLSFLLGLATRTTRSTLFTSGCFGLDLITLSASSACSARTTLLPTLGSLH